MDDFKNKQFCVHLFVSYILPVHTVNLLTFLWREDHQLQGFHWVRICGLSLKITGATFFGGSPGALGVPGSLILEKSFGCVSKNYLFRLLGFHNFIMTIDGEYSCETVSTNAQVESLHFICLSFSTMFNLSSNRWRVIGRDLPTCIATYSPGMKQPSFLFS